MYNLKTKAHGLRIVWFIKHVLAQQTLVKGRNLLSVKPTKWYNILLQAESKKNCYNNEGGNER